MAHVGIEVRRLREERELNQAQLAVLIGTGPAAISRIESGKQNPNSTTLVKLAGALDVEVADLFPKAQAPLSFDEPEGPEEERREASIGPGSKELRRVEHELKPDTPPDEAFKKLSAAGGGALGIALADLVLGAWSHDEESNSATHKAASRFAAKTNTDPQTLLKRVIDNHAFVARRVETRRENQHAGKDASIEETA